MIVYGRQPVRELLAAGRRPVSKVWATAGAAREPWLEGAQVHVVDGGTVERQAGTDAHQGVCAETSAYPYVDPGELLEADALLVALDEVQDPQNLGAVCRTAECAGATGVVIPERRAAEVTPAVCKASSGAVEHLRVARVRNLADFLADAKAAGLWCYGADASGRRLRRSRLLGRSRAGPGGGGPRPSPSGREGLRRARRAARFVAGSPR